MEVIRSFQEYLNTVLGIKPVIYEADRVEGLPHFIYEIYDVYKVSIHKEKFVAVVDVAAEKNTPERIKKQIELISNKTKLPGIYIHSGLCSFQRKRLIDYKVNFVIPYNQMYLPVMKLDLREHFKSRIPHRDIYAPSTQAIVIYALLHNLSRLNSQIIMSNLDYSAMTVSRAFRQIANSSIGSIEREGKEKTLILLADKKELWDKSKTYMRSPVKREVWLSTKISRRIQTVAGLSALAEHTMLAPPINPVYAIYIEEWNKLVKDDSVKKSIEPIQTDSNVKLQIWRYSTNLGMQQHIVDKYSLYLSLKDEKDERVEQALRDMLDEVFNG